MKKKIISIIAVAFMLSLVVFVGAADEMYPFETDGVEYATLSSALSASQSGIVYVIRDGVVNNSITVGSGKTVIVNNGVTLYNNNSGTNYLTFGQGSSLTMYGNIYTNNVIRLEQATMNLYGDINAPNSGALSVRSPSTIYCNGVIISAQNACINVIEAAVEGTTIVVNGGTFYSSTRDEPITPLEAVNFEGDNEVTITNGLIVATSYDSVIGSITRMVNSSVNWIEIFMGAVITNALLTLICIVAFIGLGIGLIKRIKR